MRALFCPIFIVAVAWMLTSQVLSTLRHSHITDIFVPKKLFRAFDVGALTRKFRYQNLNFQSQSVGVVGRFDKMSTPFNLYPLKVVSVDLESLDQKKVDIIIVDRNIYETSPKINKYSKIKSTPFYWIYSRSVE